MKTYTVTFARNVPHYRCVGIDAPDATTALAAAKAYWQRLQQTEKTVYDTRWDSRVCHRIVVILDPDLNQVAHDIPLDACRLEFGENHALEGLDTAIQILGVHR